MQLSISEQSYQLIDQINTLISSTQGLEDNYHAKLIKVGFKMNEFVTNYHAHLSLPVSEFASYLNHDALSPLTVVLGYAELFRSVHAHMLTLDNINLLHNICDELRILTDSVRRECQIMVAKRNEFYSIQN